jgi:hypothetical protein
MRSDAARISKENYLPLPSNLDDTSTCHTERRETKRKERKAAIMAVLAKG